MKFWSVASRECKTLIAQCQEDLDTLNKVFVDTPEALGRKARLNTWYRAKDEKLLIPPPMSREEVCTLSRPLCLLHR
jgi:structural maintenance of chromosomes protein 5